VPEDELSAGYIVPSVFNKHVADMVATAVAEQARLDGVVRATHS
jgi:malic enzyme